MESKKEDCCMKQAAGSHVQHKGVAGSEGVKGQECCVSGKSHLLEYGFIVLIALLLLVSVVQAFQIADIKKAGGGNSLGGSAVSPAQDDDMASHHPSESSAPSMVGGC
ncbi:hypothetical protein HYU12_01325 [Candidatus Woesearchaeota archaeon]|nr:hypothetical protein [Candidatus Woesearchaeota archaeon]